MNFSGLKKRNLWQFFFLITYKYQAQLFGMCIDLKNRQSKGNRNQGQRIVMTGVNSMIVNCYTYNTSFHLGTCAIFRKDSYQPESKGQSQYAYHPKAQVWYSLYYILFTSLCYTSLNRALYKLIHLSDGVYS